jgi:plastocyanin
MYVLSVGCPKISAVKYLNSIPFCFAWTSLIFAWTIQYSSFGAEQVAGVPGSVKGTVTYRGQVPKSPVPDDAGQRRDLVDVDKETGGLLHVVAYLEPAGSGLKLKVNGSASAADPVVIDQFDSTFVPHLVAVRAGQTVLFTNSDPANHNVRTTAGDPENQFNVFTAVGGSYKRRFVHDPKHRPIRLGCDIHPWMRAWIYVFDHPYFAVTDQRGQFGMDAVPAGEYRLVIAQPDLKYQHERTIKVKPGESVPVELEVEK